MIGGGGGGGGDDDLSGGRWRPMTTDETLYSIKDAT